MADAGSISLEATIDTRSYQAGAKRISSANADMASSTSSAAGSIDSSSSRASGSNEKVAGSTTGMKGRVVAAWAAVASVANNVVTKAFDAIGDSVSGAVRRVDTMNNFPRIMQNLGYSSDDASKSIQKMSDHLKGLPTSLDSMTGMVQQLAPVTKSLDDATDISLAFNDALLAGGKSTDIQKNAMEQFSQILADGKPDMQAWRSIETAMPGQLNQVAKSLLGVNANSMDLYNALKSGKISMNQFTDAIVQLDSKGAPGFASFAQQAKDATNGIGTAVQNVKTATVRGIADIIQAFGADRISGAINGFGSVISSLTSFVTPMASAVGKTVDGMVSSVGKTLHAFGGTWKTIFNNLGRAVAPVGQALKDFAKSESAGEAAGSILDNALNVLTDTFAAVSKALGHVISWVGKFLDALAKTDGVQNFADALGNLIGAIGSVLKPLADAADNVLGFATNSGTAKGAGNALGKVFNKLADVINDVAGALTSVSDWVSKHQGPVSTGLTAIAAGFIAFKAASAVSSAVTALKSFASALKALTPLQTAAAGAQTLLDLAMDANPIVLVVIAIAALAAGLAYFFTQTETGRKAWAKFTAFLKSAWEKVSGFLSTSLKNIEHVFTTVATTIQKAWTDVTGFFQRISNDISSALSKAAATVRGAWESVTGFLSSVWTTISNGVSNFVTSMGSAVSGFFTGVQKAANDFVTVVGAIPVWLGEQLLAGINSMFSSLTSTISNWYDNTDGMTHTVLGGLLSFVQTIWQAIQGIVQTAINLVRTIVKVVLDLINGDWSKAWSDIRKFFEDTWNGIVSFFSPIINSLKNTISSALNNISSWWDSTWSDIKGFFTNIWNGIVGFASSVVQNLRQTISSGVSSIQNWWNSTWNSISSFFENIWNGIVRFAGWAMQNVSNPILSGVSNIQNWWNNTWSSISGFFGGIWGGIVSTAQGAIGNLSGVIGSIYGTVTGAISGAGDWLYNAGQQIIQGLINGIGGAFGWLRDEIDRLGNNVINWAKGVLGIGSPSRKFRDEVGKWIPAGISVGIDKTMPDMDDNLETGLTHTIKSSSEVVGSSLGDVPRTIEMASSSASSTVHKTADDPYGMLVSAFRDALRDVPQARVINDPKSAAVWIAGDIDAELGKRSRRQFA